MPNRIVVLNPQVIAVEHPTIAQQWLVTPLFQAGEVASVEVIKPSRKALQEAGDKMAAVLSPIMYTHLSKVGCIADGEVLAADYTIKLGAVGGHECIAFVTKRLVKVGVSDLNQDKDYDHGTASKVARKLGERMLTKDGQISRTRCPIKLLQAGGVKSTGLLFFYLGSYLSA